MNKGVLAWKKAVLDPNRIEEIEGELTLPGYRRIPGGWVSQEIERLEQGNQVWQDTVFQGRVGDPFSTTGIETEIVAAKLSRFIETYNIRKDAIVMDGGCADGRMTHLLLDAGMQCIVSTDLDQGGVRRLVASLKPEQEENVFAIVDDFNHVPIASEAIDLILAYGLFAEMPDFRKALRSAVRMLKPGGLLFYVDPILEHALVYALVRNDVEEFLRVARTSTRARMWDEKHRRYKVHPSRELEGLIACAELEVLQKDGVSILPSLVFGGVLQELALPTEQKQELRNQILALEAADLGIYRQVIYICRKS